MPFPDTLRVCPNPDTIISLSGGHSLQQVHLINRQWHLAHRIHLLLTGDPEAFAIKLDHRVLKNTGTNDANEFLFCRFRQTAIAYSELYGKEIRYCSDRKEEKDHGADKGSFLGSKLQDGDRVVMIEDVTTSGKSMEETVPKVRGAADVTIASVMDLIR